ncbi:MAG: hypothetical protein K6T75_10430 [Acetobacteraceae bacterium]|nr:hypothetical protein [Acetobacteraceae bacterium]
MIQVAALVFEGGSAPSRLEQELLEVRHASALDAVERLQRTPGIGPVFLVTDAPGLAEKAAALGAEAALTSSVPGGEPFHFGRCLAGLIERWRLQRVICLGGGAGVLLTPEDFSGMVGVLETGDPVVVVNNPLSADVLGFSPAAALFRIEPPAEDNFLGFLLMEAGLRRVVLPPSARTGFDLDTPSDALVLRLCGAGGPRVREALQRLDWPSPLERALGPLRRRWAEVVVAGRVGPAVVAHLNARMEWRLRVFSEERGMKALGRDRDGRAVSLLGFLEERVGPVALFRLLSRAGEAAFIDSRVLFAHWGREVSQSDRFASDLGRWDEVSDPRVRRFTRAAAEAPLPVVLGGHSLVSGGLWLLADWLGGAAPRGGP